MTAKIKKLFPIFPKEELIEIYKKDKSIIEIVEKIKEKEVQNVK